MPKLNHCGPSGESVADNCLEDERVHFINASNDEWIFPEGGRGQATTFYDVIFVDEKSFVTEELPFGSKLVDGGLLVGSSVVSGNGEETCYRYQSSSNANVEPVAGVKDDEL